MGDGAIASGSAGAVQSGVLASGGSVLSMERPGCEVVSLQIWIPAGSRMEVEHPGSGMAHFLEHMVFKGTARRTALEINRLAERCGGFLNAYTFYDRTVYHIDLPVDHAAEGLDLLADFVWHPSLAAEGFAPEREVILREIAMYQDDPDSFLYDSLLSAAFREDLLRYPVIGLEERFRQLTVEDLRSFHSSHYRSPEMFLLMAGDIRDDLREKSAIVSPNLCRGGTVERAEQSPLHGGESPAPVRLRLYGTWEGARGAVLLFLPAEDARGILLAEWIVEAVSGGESSPLNRLLRIEKEWVHFFEGFLYPVGGRLVVGFSWLAESDRLAAVEEAVILFLCQLERNIPADEVLERARMRLRFGKIRREESVEGWAARGGEWKRTLGYVPGSEREQAWIQSFGKEDFREFASRHFVEDQIVAGQLHPEKS